MLEREGREPILWTETSYSVPHESLRGHTQHLKAVFEKEMPYLSPFLGMHRACCLFPNLCYNLIKYPCSFRESTLSSCPPYMHLECVGVCGSPVLSEDQCEKRLLFYFPVALSPHKNCINHNALWPMTRVYFSLALTS